MLNKITRMAIDQLRLMEQVFYTCRLDRYANAPDNRGWMNLFRTWGRSPTLNDVFVRYEQFLTREFVEFYVSYLAFYERPIDREPVPHPWDHSPKRPEFPAAAPEMWRGRSRAVRGAFLDPGLREADPFKPSTTQADAGDPGASSARPDAARGRDSSDDTD